MCDFGMIYSTVAEEEGSGRHLAERRIRSEGPAEEREVRLTEAAGKIEVLERFVRAEEGRMLQVHCQS